MNTKYFVAILYVALLFGGATIGRADEEWQIEVRVATGRNMRKAPSVTLIGENVREGVKKDELIQTDGDEGIRSTIVDRRNGPLITVELVWKRGEERVERANLRVRSKWPVRIVLTDNGFAIEEGAFKKGEAMIKSGRGSISLVRR
jgi:hypothetical protein